MKNKLANPVPATAARRATSNALGRHQINHQPLGAMQSSLGFTASPYSFRETISNSIQTRNNFRHDYQARRRNSVIFEDLNGVSGKIEEVSSVTKKLRPQTRTKKKLGKNFDWFWKNVGTMKFVVISVLYTHRNWERCLKWN